MPSGTFSIHRTKARVHSRQQVKIYRDESFDDSPANDLVTRSLRTQAHKRLRTPLSIVGKESEDGDLHQAKRSRSTIRHDSDVLRVDMVPFTPSHFSYETPLPSPPRSFFDKGYDRFDISRDPTPEPSIKPKLLFSRASSNKLKENRNQKQKEQRIGGHALASPFHSRPNSTAGKPTRTGRTKSKNCLIRSTSFRTFHAKDQHPSISIESSPATISKQLESTMTSTGTLM